MNITKEAFGTLVYWFVVIIGVILMIVGLVGLVYGSIGLLKLLIRYSRTLE